jgi:sodium transport system permease protein
MKWTNIQWIYRRELRDQLRDRRMLFTISVLPLLLYPLVTMSFVQIAQFQRAHESPVLLLGAEYLPAAPALLEEGHFAAEFCLEKELRLLQVTVAGPAAEADPTTGRQTAQQRMMQRDFDAVLVIPPGFAQQLSAPPPARPVTPSADGNVEAPAATTPTGPTAASHPRSTSTPQSDPIVSIENAAAPSPTLAPSSPIIASSETDPQPASPSNAASIAERVADTDSASVPTSAAPQPEIVFDSAQDKSRIARDRVERVLKNWRAELVRRNLDQRHVPRDVVEPFRTETTDIAEETRKRAAVWSKILPFIVLIWALTGAFYPAVDLCAGEKERGTLETLLCSPAERAEIVLGKLLTVMTFSIASSVLNLISMGVTGLLFVSQMQAMADGEMGFNLGPPPLSSCLWLLLALIPISALFSALSLAIAAFARSSKEGQYYLLPLLLATLPLMLLPMMPAAELDWGTSLIPVTGVLLLLQSLIEGQYLQSLRFSASVIAVTFACCWFAIRWAIDQFNNESVLFRENERWAPGIWLRHLFRDRRDTPTLAEAMLCCVLLLIIHFFASLSIGAPTDWLSFAKTQAISLIAFIAAPPLIMAVILTRSPRQTLLLNLPSPWVVLVVGLLAVVIHPVGFAVSRAVQQLYPFNEEMLAQVRLFGSLLESMRSQTGIWGVILVIAILPAICEELAFRGFILSGLRHMGHRWGAIVICSAFFGATHGILQQSLPAFALGIVLGYVAVQTESILACMLFHAIYNSITVVFASLVSQPATNDHWWTWLMTVEADSFQYRPATTITSVLLSLLLLLWLHRLPHRATVEEKRRALLDQQPQTHPA